MFLPSKKSCLFFFSSFTISSCVFLKFPISQNVMEKTVELLSIVIPFKRPWVHAVTASINLLNPSVMGWGGPWALLMQAGLLGYFLLSLPWILQHYIGHSQVFSPFLQELSKQGEIFPVSALVTVVIFAILQWNSNSNGYDRIACFLKINQICMNQVFCDRRMLISNHFMSMLYQDSPHCK